MPLARGRPAAIPHQDGQRRRRPGSHHLQPPVVRKEGLEPPRLAAPEPKSGASTHSATFATFRLYYNHVRAESFQVVLTLTRNNMIHKGYCAATYGVQPL